MDKAVRGLKRLVKPKDKLQLELTKDNNEPLTEEEQKAANSKIAQCFSSENVEWAKIKEY